jgi:hypothetical protein
MVSIVTRQGKLKLASGQIAWASATLKLMLVTPAYVPDETHSTPADASAYELTGTGYTGGYGGSGRKTLASKTAALDSDGRVVFDAADLAWTGINAGTVGYVLVIQETGGTDASSVLIAALAYPVTTTDGSTLDVTWPSTGLFYLA